MDKQQLLAKLNEFLIEKGLDAGEQYLDPETRLRVYGLPALEATKGILYDIYSYQPPTGSNLPRKVKNKIINAIARPRLTRARL